MRLLIFLSFLCFLWRKYKTKTGNVFFLEGIGIVKVNEDGKNSIGKKFL